MREETLHITLAFLGERSEADTREAHAVVQEVAASHDPFHVSLTGLGVFPSSARPRVVWLGLADPAAMHKLYRAFERERARLGIPVEGRAYHPYVTLGRVPPHASRGVRDTLTPALKTVQFEAPVGFGSLDLMRSELTAKGPRYTALLFGMRRSRYRGQAKTHFQETAAAAAINVVRVTDWLTGLRPKTTRLSRFAVLNQAA